MILTRITEYEERFLKRVVKFTDNLYNELADESYEPTIYSYYELISEYFKELADNERAKHQNFLSNLTKEHGGEQ